MRKDERDWEVVGKGDGDALERDALLEGAEGGTTSIRGTDMTADEIACKLKEEKTSAAQAAFRKENERRRGMMLGLMLIPILLMILVWHINDGGRSLSKPAPGPSVLPNNTALVHHWNKGVQAGGQGLAKEVVPDGHVGAEPSARERDGRKDYSLDELVHHRVTPAPERAPEERMRYHGDHGRRNHRRMLRA